MEHEQPIERLTIGTIGPPPTPLVRAVVRHMSEVLPIPCGLHAEPLEVEPVRLAGRDQLDADRMLAQVETIATVTNEALCGLTPADIGHPLFTHFFGRARHHGRGMVVSLARLAPEFYGLPADDDIWVRRAGLEILHELGHLIGLLHCDDFGCIMHFAPTVEAIDTRGNWFCSDCIDQFRARLICYSR
ncbi:MAG: hypothetical protein ACYTHK_14090 [Planctomycetota bacterium]|jgi:archaemetzincin